MWIGDGRNDTHTYPHTNIRNDVQLSIKKNNAAREAAARAQLSESQMPPMIYVPLPTWRETKERIRMQIDVTRRACQQRSREWEEKEQVGYSGKKFLTCLISSLIFLEEE